MFRKHVLTGRKRRGFTLIELMLVVTIIGVLATVAIPEFQKLVIRTKKSERGTSVGGLIKSINEYWVANGKLPGTVGSFTLPPNPAQPPDGSKQRFDTTLGSWGDFNWRPHGELYFRYEISATYASTGGTLYLTTRTDLDRNGIPNVMVTTYTLQDGVWQWYEDNESVERY
jgi:prepilin-type N-terminal cleavage/methylation domain-containing protein